MEMALVDRFGGEVPLHGGETALVRLPAAVEEFVRLALDGPSLAKHWLLLGMYGVQQLAFGVVLFEALRRVDDSPTANLAGLLQFISFEGWAIVNTGAIRNFRRTLHAEADGFLAARGCSARSSRRRARELSRCR